MKLRFVRQRPETSRITTFVFAPTEPLAWTAGQSIRLEIPRSSFGVDERRFTISAAPYEGEVHITTRLSESEFKRHLFALTPGMHVDAFAVDGSFVWPDDVVNPVFMAAGIGVTPYYSMLKQRVHEGKLLAVTLLYGGSDEQFPFQPSLDAWQQDSPDFAVQYYPSRRFDAAFVASIYKSLGDRMVYVSGPSSMVASITAALRAHGLPEHQIKADDFIGAPA